MKTRTDHFCNYQHLREQGSSSCNQWLVGFNEDGEPVTWDGCHSDEAGVTQALALHLGIGFKSNDEVDTWVWLEFPEGEDAIFHDVEADYSNVNTTAMSQSRAMVQGYYKATGPDDA